MTGLFTALDPAELHAGRRLDSCGKPFPDAEMQIVDPESRDLPPGEVGEIICRTPQMTAGYWNRLEATASVIQNG